DQSARRIWVIEAAAADAFDRNQHVGAGPGSAADARGEVDTDATGRIGVSGEIDAEATDQDVIANAPIEDVITVITAQDIVAIAPDQGVVAIATDDEVRQLATDQEVVASRTKYHVVVFGPTRDPPVTFRPHLH